MRRDGRRTRKWLNSIQGSPPSATNQCTIYHHHRRITHIKQQQKWSPNNNRYIGGKFFSSSSSNRLSIIKSLEHLQSMCEKTLRPRHLLQLIGCCPLPSGQCRAGGTHNITAVVLLRYEMAPCHSWPRLFWFSDLLPRGIIRTSYIKISLFSANTLCTGHRTDDWALSYPGWLADRPASPCGIYEILYVSISNWKLYRNQSLS